MQKSRKQFRILRPHVCRGFRGSPSGTTGRREQADHNNHAKSALSATSLTHDAKLSTRGKAKDTTHIIMALIALGVALTGLAVMPSFSARIDAFATAIETNRHEMAEDLEAVLGRCRQGAHLVGLLFIILLIISVANLLILQTGSVAEITENPDNKLTDCRPRNAQPPFSELYPWQAIRWAVESLIRNASSAED